MRKLGFLFFFLLLFSSRVYAAEPATDQTPPATPTTSGAFSILVKAVNDWQSLKQQRSEKEVALNFEENLSFPNLIELEKIETLLVIGKTELEELKSEYEKQETLIGESILVNSIESKESQIETLEADKANYETAYNSKKEKQNNNIAKLTQELEDLEEGILKQKDLMTVQLLKVFYQFLLIVSLVLFLLVIKFLAGKLVTKFSHKMNEQRRLVLLRLNRVVFNVLIFLILLGTIFSELTSLLPFLALLGTGVAFAIRDVLSSFLGWFLIGGSNGYRRGQIIQMGKHYGKVVEVTPFLTMLNQMSGDKETGEITSFPNKVIFEQPIVHFSKNFGFVYKELQFLMSENTDIKESKALLKSIIEPFIKEEREDESKSFKTFLQKSHIKEEDCNPCISIKNGETGYNLKAKILVKQGTASDIAGSIEEAFLSAVQDSKNVKFHYVDNGRDQVKK